ncbi:MAG: hypothetical protein ACREH8_08930 [Opitutaceae bacterium]
MDQRSTTVKRAPDLKTPRSPQARPAATLFLALLLGGGALTLFWGWSALTPTRWFVQGTALTAVSFEDERPSQNGMPASASPAVATADRMEPLESHADATISAEQFPDGKEKDASIAAALAAWSEKDCAEALARIEQQGVRTLEYSVRERLLEGLLQMDPKTALERLEGSSSPTLREDLRRAFVARLVEIAPQHAAIELLITGRENWMLNPAVGDRVIAQWMRQAPEAVARLLANLPEGIERNQTTLAAVDAWSAPSPAETAAWVETLPAGETRDEAFKRMTLAWSGQDLEAAMAWLSRLPASRSRDVGIASLCSQLADMYPAMLSSWAATIQDSSLRQRAFAALHAGGSAGP